MIKSDHCFGREVLKIILIYDYEEVFDSDFHDISQDG